MLQRHPLSLAIVLSSLALVACNSNDDDNVSLPNKAVTTTIITVTPSLGKILNAKVSLRNAKTNAEIASAKALDANGVASFVVPNASLVEPILASVIPNDTGDVQYFDEATNSLQTIAITAANRSQPLLRAATKVTANTNIGVTALTEAAVQTAEAKAGGLAINIDGVNQLIKTQLQLTHSILQAPLVIGSTAQYNQLASTTISESQRVYAAYLANLAKQAALLNPSSTQPAFDIVQTLAADFKDDFQLNASFDASKIAIAYSSAFATAWLEAFSKVLAALKNLSVTNPDITNFFATAGQNTAIAQPIRVVDGVAEYACADESKLRSSAGSQGMNIDFINQSGSGLKIFWLNYNGGRVSYNANLANTQTHAQGTYVTHPWLVTDSSGVCKGIYRPVTATKKNITFKADGVMIGDGVVQPTTCTTGVETQFATTLSNTPYANGQKVCFSATTSSLGFDNKTLTSPVKNTVVQAPYSAYSFKDGSYSYEVVFNNTALYEINLSSTSFLGQFTPLVSTPVVETCASKNLAVASLSSIADYNGDYKENGAVVFNLNTATAKATVKGTEGNISEVCGPTVLNNGTNHVLITDKGSVTLFKTTAGVYSAEGKEFADTTKVFYGEKASVVTNNCTSQGADNKLGFTNAPTDFCSFSKSTSIAITNPDTYNFFNADKKENVEVTVVNNAVTSVSIENDTYGFACGVGALPACNGVTLNTANTNTTEFVFNNTALGVVNGASQGITVKNGSLIHMQNVTQPIVLAANGTATGTITNVQYNKDGTVTGGKGELVANTYQFSGDLNTAYTLKVNDTIRNLRYELTNKNGQFTSVNLYSLANSPTPSLVYVCDTTGDNTCLSKITFTQGTKPTLEFSDMKMRGVFQPQFDSIMNGKVTLNP